MTYHVKVSGGNGSGLDDASAWSYAKLNATYLPPGDKVLFNRGDVYHGELTIRSGSVGNPITYGAYGVGANPKLTVLTELTSWTLHRGNIYYAPLDEPIQNLITVDGVVKGMGRYPKKGYLKYTGHTGVTSVSGEDIGKLPFNATGGEIVLRKVRWIIDRHPITSHTGDTVTITASGIYGAPWAYHPVDGNGFFIQSNINCLTEDGDWYYDKANKRLYMYFTNSPEGRIVKASTNDRNFRISGKSYITFENLDFEGGNIHGASLQNANHIIFNDVNFFDQGGTAIYGLTVDGLTIKGGSIERSLNAGVWVEYAGSNCTIDGLKVTDTALIAGAARSGDASANGINIYGEGTTIINCRVKNSGYNGIQFNDNNALVERNFVDRYCIVKDDGGGIYTYVESAIEANRIIRKNIVINGIGAFEGAESNIWEKYGKAAAIYLDGDSNHVTVEDNICAHGEWGGIFVNNNHDNKIINNLFFDFAVGMYFYQSAIPGVMRGFVVTGNKVIAKTAAQRVIEVRQGVADDIRLIGTFNNNVYARPIAETKTIRLHQQYPGGPGVRDITFEEWQDFGHDALSSRSKISTDSTENFNFDYNDSLIPVTKELAGTWRDVEGNISYEIPAFGGRVLVRQQINTAQEISAYLERVEASIENIRQDIQDIKDLL